MTRTWPDRWLVFCLDKYGTFSIESYSTRQEQRNVIKKHREGFSGIAVIGIDIYAMGERKYLISELLTIVDELQSKLK